GAFAYGALPEVDDLFRRQARELDRKKREALLHQIQKILHEQVTQAPIYHLGFPIGVGPRVDDIMATAIPGFYMSPYEDLKLRRPQAPAPLSDVTDPCAGASSRRRRAPSRCRATPGARPGTWA